MASVVMINRKCSGGSSGQKLNSKKNGGRKGEKKDHRYHYLQQKQVFQIPVQQELYTVDSLYDDLSIITKDKLQSTSVVLCHQHCVSPL